MYLFTSKRLGVREVTVDDAKQFQTWWNNGELMASMGFENGLGVSLADMQERFANQVNDIDPKRKRRTYIICRLDNNQAIGELTYGAYEPARKKLGLAMKICELDQQGKGYGEESLRAFMDYLQERFSLDAIDIDSLADNQRAMSLYKKVGFDVTSIHKDYWQDPSGGYHDLVFMSYPFNKK